MVTTTTARSVKKGAKILGAIAAGAAVGYATGILAAPASGAETRRRIKRRAEDEAMNAKNAIRRKARQASDAIADLTTRQRLRSV